MSHTPITAPQTGRSTNDFTRMVGELGRKADANRDGSVSSAEFAQFLDQLIEEPARNTAAPPAKPDPAPAPAKKG